MTKMTEQFLKLMFNPNEEICISPNKYGYHSVPQETLNGHIYLKSPSEKLDSITITESDITMLAINPIKGFKRDSSVTSYRSFLVELDDGSLDSQKKYIDEIGMPHSVCIYSGNKSLHYGIVMGYTLPLSIWKHIAQWILNIVKKADQQVKNPSRGIRFPGNMRKDGKMKRQSLVSIGKRVDPVILFEWLNNFPKEKPKPTRRIVRRDYTGPRRIPNIVKEALNEGITEERNSTWFRMACSMAGSGYSENDTMHLFEEHFEEDSDFSRREWESCIKSAYKNLQGVV